MRPSDLPELRELTLCREMADEAFARLLRAAYVQTFPPSVELITEGDRPDFLHVVLHGTVELFAAWHRRETTLAVIRPISTFILAATIRDEPYLMSARTIEKSRILLLPSEDVRAVFHADNAFARSVVTELASCYRAVIRHTKNLKLRNSTERLANFLIRQQEKSGGAPSFEFEIEKRKLASYLGMTAENLSRALRSLRAQGVEVDGNRVRIRDREALVRLARPTPLIDGPAR